MFPLLAENEQEPNPEALALRWLRGVCSALDVLHRNGLIHGDITPRNLIVSGSDLVLIDYDFVTRIGDRIEHPGTPLYSSPSYVEGHTASPSDDLYALAATLYHVVFEREPFPAGSLESKRVGLHWDGIDRDEYPVLAEFLARATDPDPTQRFASVAEAMAWLEANERERRHAQAEPAPEDTTAQPWQAVPLRPQRVEWLHWLLQSYPGSLWGNRETRGLDSDFAARTYVETELEEVLLCDIPEQRVRLVVLCGNGIAGKARPLPKLCTASCKAKAAKPTVTSASST
ncbi:MAG: hypothetical protein N3C12_01430 [Candidatus Binatia bacterium]|nr:hypothetical protein [Candidatus Binatia bacterium]